MPDTRAFAAIDGDTDTPHRVASPSTPDAPPDASAAELPDGAAAGLPARCGVEIVTRPDLVDVAAPDPDTANVSVSAAGQTIGRAGAAVPTCTDCASARAGVTGTGSRLFTAGTVVAPAATASSEPNGPTALITIPDSVTPINADRTLRTFRPVARPDL